MTREEREQLLDKLEAARKRELALVRSTSPHELRRYIDELNRKLCRVFEQRLILTRAVLKIAALVDEERCNELNAILAYVGEHVEALDTALLSHPGESHHG